MTTMPDGSITLSERLQLNKLYRKGPSAYGSIKSLCKSSGLTRKKVETFLESKSAYTKFKQRRGKFVRLSARARFINDIWCLDLAQMDKLASDNSGVKYLLVAVDIFSRFVRVEPLKSKSAKSTENAFVKMCGRSSSGLDFPKKLWIDRGKEFLGDFKNFCEDVGIVVYHTNSETKAAYAERVIRSLKNVIYRYLEEKNTFNYLKELPAFVETLNSRVSSATNLAPKHVMNEHFLQVLYGARNSYNPLKIGQSKAKFSVGDRVRIAKVDKAFRRGYKSQFTDELFTITKIATRYPIVTYIIKDQTGETILGKFYQSELSRQIT